MAVTLDRIDLVSAVERHGVVISLTRKALITGLVRRTSDALFEALDRLGIQEGSTYIAEGRATIAGPAGLGLVLVERRPTILPEDNTKAEVELLYEQFFHEFQPLNEPPTPGSRIPIFIEIDVEAGLQQIQTMFDEPLVNPDATNQITVEHTFPDGSVPGEDPDPQFPGKTVKQGGLITVFVPQKTIRLRGLFTTAKTESISILEDALLGKVNSKPWIDLGDSGRDSDEGKWLCTTANHRVYDISNHPKIRVKYDLAFQFNEATWNPEIIFIDERTGKPPPDLVRDVGFKRIDYLPSTDFNAFRFLDPFIWEVTREVVGR